MSPANDIKDDIEASERLHGLMQRVIALRSDVTTELMYQRWKELRRQSARHNIEDAERALNNALREMNSAAESERKLSADRYVCCRDAACAAEESE